MSDSKTTKRPPSNDIIVPGKPCKQRKSSNSGDQTESHLDSQAWFSDSDYSGSKTLEVDHDEFMELDDNGTSTSPSTDSEESCSGDSGFHCNGIHPVDISDEDAKPVEGQLSPNEKDNTSSTQPEETLGNGVPTNILVGDNYVRLPRPILWSW